LGRPSCVEGHEVDGVRIWRQRLVIAVERPRPIDDLIFLAADPDELLEHEVVVDRGHAPDHGLDCAGLDQALVDLVRRRLGRLRGANG
jgi:hypothetical protein